MTEQRIRTIADTIAGWLATHGAIGFAVISLLYWPTALHRAAHDPLTFDETVTWQVAHLPTLRVMWAALADGADQQLPLMHLQVRLSQALFGATHFSTRLIGVLGVWVLLLSLYLLLKRHLSSPYALIGAILPLLTFAWPYAYQARAYGMLVGAAAFALLCWQEAAEGSQRRRRLALAGVTIGLAVALSCHMMAVLLVLPFGAAEILRSVRRGRIDPWMWVAFALAAPVVAIYPATLATTHSWNLHGLYPRPEAIDEFYSLVFAPGVTPLLAALLAGGLALHAGNEGEPRRPSTLPGPLFAGLLCFALLPAAFIGVAFLSRHFFFAPRYGMLAIVGLAGLLAAGANMGFRGSIRAGSAIFLVLMGWFALTQSRPVLHATPSPAAEFRSSQPLLMEALGTGLPVVSAVPTTFLRADFYLPSEVAKLTFVTDYRNTFRSPGEDNVQKLFPQLKKHISLHADVETLDAYLAANTRFLLHVQSDVRLEWIWAGLLQRGCRVTLRENEGSESLFEVSCGK